MTTKARRAALLVNRLADRFGVARPLVVEVSNEVAAWGALGLYCRAATSIHLRPRASIETLAHEFAHHLDYELDGETDEPPARLPDVREAITGTREMCAVELDFMQDERVPIEWEF